MSMSQEEIEALMNGLDLGDSAESVESDVENKEHSELSKDDIESLMAQTSSIPAQSEDDELDDLINRYSAMTDGKNVVSEIREVVSNVAEVQSVDEAQYLAEFDADNAKSFDSDIDHEVIAKNWTDKQIESGIFPLPVEKHNKVVNQLHQVNQDGEEQATRIIDVLSYVLDDNNEFNKNAKSLENFIVSQTALLQTLVQKFPNIPIFAEQLNIAKSVANIPQEMSNKLNAENSKLFEAMELMQFHDINRQKIERVMSVIRKLSKYLNNLFDDGDHIPEVKIAKHIHGDNNEVVDESDLEALIAEFGKN